jgi:hypothetical protein
MQRECFRRGVAGMAALAAVVLLLGVAARAEAGPTCELNVKGLSACFGAYALCDKAVCKTLPGGTKVECTCPVEEGVSIANLSQTNGTCTPTQKGGIYSFFSFKGIQAGSLLACPSGSKWAQCWNAPCELQPGGKEARCVCPLCTHSYVTPGGDCNPANCGSQIMVGAPFPVKGTGGMCPAK